ncbi:hypothetical protein CDO27_03780 [Sinorhizobium meliloti]|nr:hypothetical protein CDO27_03780 [Sinorhizobium meliloti]
MRWTAPAPHPPAGTFSPQAGRRDKRRQPNPAFTVRPRERAGAAYPFSPPAGRRWRQPVEGQPRPSGVEAVGFPRDPFMSSIRRTGPQEICACRSHEMRRRCRQADEGRRRTHCSSDRLPRNKKAPVKTEASCQSRLLTSKRINVPCSRRPTSSSGR